MMNVWKIMRDVWDWCCLLCGLAAAVTRAHWERPLMWWRRYPFDTSTTLQKPRWTNVLVPIAFFSSLLCLYWEMPTLPLHQMVDFILPSYSSISKWKIHFKLIFTTRFRSLRILFVFQVEFPVWLETKFNEFTFLDFLSLTKYCVDYRSNKSNTIWIFFKLSIFQSV